MFAQEWQDDRRSRVGTPTGYKGTEITKALPNIATPTGSRHSEQAKAIAYVGLSTGSQSPKLNQELLKQEPRRSGAFAAQDAEDAQTAQDAEAMLAQTCQDNAYTRQPAVVETLGDAFMELSNMLRTRSRLLRDAAAVSQDTNDVQDMQDAQRAHYAAAQDA